MNNRVRETPGDDPKDNRLGTLMRVRRRYRPGGGRLPYSRGMCRSIITLRRPDQSPTDAEVRAAALQYVRKISGYRVPSKKNEEAFNAAVEEIAHASQHLLEAVGATLTTHESAA